MENTRSRGEGNFDSPNRISSAPHLITVSGGLNLQGLPRGHGRWGG